MKIKQLTPSEPIPTVSLPRVPEPISIAAQREQMAWRAVARSEEDGSPSWRIALLRSIAERLSRRSKLLEQRDVVVDKGRQAVLLNRK